MVICPKDRDNSLKRLLIPNVVIRVKGLMSKWRNPLWEEPASHQLVGRVMAYQGDDG